MSRIPNVDELVQLEAERDQLLSMIGYHNSPRLFQAWRASAWFVVVAIAIICGVGVLMAADFLAGQIDPPVFIFLVLVLPLSMFILGRRVTVFGTTFRVVDTLTGWPTGQPAGEPQARQRLADCEARITELKEGRP
ncbi:MAG TPA: hypothetical protein VE111_08495 [Bradyrhizobium sp.]|nr:hypothetical protein [Bradyrhizobium sp.]